MQRVSHGEISAADEPEERLDPEIDERSSYRLGDRHSQSSGRLTCPDHASLVASDSAPPPQPDRLRQFGNSEKSPTPTISPLLASGPRAP